LNLQQVPRDTLVRGVFGAPPGSSFVEADYSQIELRVAAFLAREPTMLNLYATGQDIHMRMAMRMTGKPKERVTKEERKRAKAVNFGFLYGMGVGKFIKTAWANYGVRVTEDESAAFRKAFFDEFPELLRWHARQRHMVAKYARVESPFGRVRHLPDINSPDPGVRAEAERQAINSPVQGFASDLALLSLVDIDREFRSRGLLARPIGTVHDAVNFEIPNEELSVALPIIKDTMEDTARLQERFGINLDIPIIADLKVGERWGGARELTSEEVYAWAS
jgi:DNA polymerase I-like protein with 3'-5' exonuclease and polymerase domains